MLSAVNQGHQWPSVSKGMVLRGSGVYLSSGHVGLDHEGNPITTSLEDQVVAVFEEVKANLAEAGLTFDHVARTTIFVTSFDPDLVATIRKVRARYYNSERPPAGVMVQAGLYDPRLHLEVEVIAVVP